MTKIFQYKCMTTETVIVNVEALSEFEADTILDNQGGEAIEKTYEDTVKQLVGIYNAKEKPESI